jgi:hypothetical protein
LPSPSQVLRDPRQRRFFAAKDLHDLFTLGEEYTAPKQAGTAKQEGREGGDVCALYVSVCVIYMGRSTPHPSRRARQSKEGEKVGACVRCMYLCVFYISEEYTAYEQADTAKQRGREGGGVCALYVCVCVCCLLRIQTCLFVST